MERCSDFSLRISESWALTGSNWVVMTTMPETVAQRIERMEPSFARYLLECVGGVVLNQVGIQLKAVPGLGEDCCQEGERGDGWPEGEGEAGS